MWALDDLSLFQKFARLLLSFSHMFTSSTNTRAHRQVLYSTLIQVHVQAGLVHGDFREANILVDRSDPWATPYLIDFSHARAHSDKNGKCPGPKECDELREVAKLLCLPSDSDPTSSTSLSSYALLQASNVSKH